jgi:hypothetical protein
VRAAFRRLWQALAVLGVESVADLYTLPGPPAGAAGAAGAGTLTRGEVRALLAQRAAGATAAGGGGSGGGGVTPFSTAALDAVQWERVAAAVGEGGE